MTVYKKQDIPERYHIKKHHRVPPLYLLADEGYAIAYVSESGSVTNDEQAVSLSI